jgi:hypothetical protein
MEELDLEPMFEASLEDFEGEDFCSHCGKEFTDFSDLGCGHCDRRHPEFGTAG